MRLYLGKSISTNRSQRLTPQGFNRLFENVVLIDFNYDRIFPQYIHMALQRLYEFSKEEATETLKGLRTHHPYGSLGSLPWQEANAEALAFGDQTFNLPAVAKRIRTYTEERNDPEISQIRQAIGEARQILVLGFGFHNQNIEILSVGRHQRSLEVFMTVQGISPESHVAVARKMQEALKAINSPELLQLEAKNLMIQLQTSISLAAS